MSDSIIYDLVLTGGRVIDPESGMDAVRNVGISDGEVRAISVDPLEGRDVVDATGKVAPVWVCIWCITW